MAYSLCIHTVEIVVVVVVVAVVVERYPSCGDSFHKFCPSCTIMPMPMSEYKEQDLRAFKN